MDMGSRVVGGDLPAAWPPTVPDDDGPAPLPWPPPSCHRVATVPANELPRAVRTGQVWVRIGGLRHALSDAPLRSEPRYRFDAPRRPDPVADPPFAVWYAGETALAALCEVFGERRRYVTPEQRGKRRWGRVRWTRDLRLIDLRAPRVLAVLQDPPKLDGRIGDHGDYRLTRAWADWFHRCVPYADGLLYVGRKSGQMSVALYHGRCRGALEAVEEPAMELDGPELQAAWTEFEHLTGIRRTER